MRADTLDEYRLLFVTDLRIQAVLVAFQVKNYVLVSQKTRARVARFHVHRTAPLRLLHFLDPYGGLTYKVGVTLREFQETLQADQIQRATPKASIPTPGTYKVIPHREQSHKKPFEVKWI